MGVETLGYIGSICNVLSYAVSMMIPLRVLSLLSSLVLLVLGLLTHSVPTMLEQGILLPINLFRLWQMLLLIRRTKSASDRHLQTVEWLKPWATRRKCGAGETLFCRGEVATAMFFIESGQYVLVETGIGLAAGDVVGELGFLSPENRRTQTVRCLVPGTLQCVTYDDLKQLYFQNPQFGFYFLRLVADRLFHNAALAAEPSRVQPGVPA